MFDLKTIDGAVKHDKVLQEKDIEIGENANGQFIKFPNGLLICTSTISRLDVSVTSPWGSLFESGAINLGQMPSTFKKLYFSNISIMHESYGAIVGTSKVGLNSWNSISVCRPLSTTGCALKFNCFAIGTWK